jgi:hypothetical protein
MKTIVLNSRNITNSYNNELTFQFPSGGFNLAGYEIALNSVNIYYSWFNINKSQYNNADLSYVWIDGTTNNITIPDGFYNASDLNNYFQYVFVKKGHYLVDVKLNNIFLMSIQTNPTYYAIQFTFIPMSVSSALASGYSKPSGVSWAIPTNSITPSINIFDNGFKNIIGFSNGTYPKTPQTSIYSVYSNVCPQEKEVSSLLLSCSLVNSKFSIPNNILHSFSPDTTAFGAMITSHSYNYAWADIVPANYTEFKIRIVDQLYRDIQIIDPSMIITLVIREKPKQ